MEPASQQNVCNETTYRELFLAHARQVRNFLCYKGASPAQAEDLMQEAFLRLWQNCRKVTAEKSRGFLFTVSGNLFLDSLKRRAVELKFQRKPREESSHENPQFLLETQELQERLERALADLPDSQRVVFLMNRMDKLTYAEIAERLDLSVKAVEKRMHLALLELRLILKNI